jgi:hypothetical protein
MTTDSPPVADEHVRAHARAAYGIYGIIISGGVMAATAATKTIPQITVAVIVTLLVYWVAERYAHVMALLMLRGPNLSRHEILQDLRDGWAIVSASFLPLLVLIGAFAFGAERRTAVLIALCFSTGLLTVIGWQIAAQARLGVLGRLGSAAAATALGLVLIALKTSLH